MTRNEFWRQAVLQLKERGVNQKVIAGAIDTNPTWLSRWLRRDPNAEKKEARKQPKARAINADEIDRLEAYLREWRDLLSSLLEGRTDLPDSVGEFRATAHDAPAAKRRERQAGQRRKGA